MLTPWQISVFVFSLLCCLVLTRAVREYAHKRSWVFYPNSNRHIHRRGIPRLGGVALAITVTASICLTALLTFLPGVPPIHLRETAPILLATLLVFLVGLADDCHPIAAWVKLLVTFLAASLLYFCGVHFLSVTASGWHGIALSFADYCLTIGWVILITNALNLIDGLDGLATGSAFFPALLILYFALRLDHSGIAVLMLAMIGAILGFLRFNFNPASIFLGDGGSLLIGFLLSASGIVALHSLPPTSSLCILLLAFGVPCADVFMAVLRRTISSRPLFSPDGEHIHHRLISRGFSQRSVALILYAISALTATAGALFSLPGLLLHLAVVLSVMALFILGIRQLRYHELAVVLHALARLQSFRSVVPRELRIRRAIESLSSSGDISHCKICKVLMEVMNASGFDAVSITQMEDGFVPLCLPRARQRLWVNSTDVASEIYAWSLRVSLISGSGHNCGELALYCVTGNRPYPIHLNLITSDLASALADELERIAPENAEFSAQSREHAGARIPAHNVPRLRTHWLETDTSSEDSLPHSRKCRSETAHPLVVRKYAVTDSH